MPESDNRRMSVWDDPDAIPSNSRLMHSACGMVRVMRVYNKSFQLAMHLETQKNDPSYVVVMAVTPPPFFVLINCRYLVMHADVKLA